MINKIIRNFIAKRMAGRSDDGIMITLKDPQKVTLAENIMADLLIRNGIDPRIIKSEDELKMILQQIENARIREIQNTGIRNTESAKVFNIEGQSLDPNKPIIGGTQTGKELSKELSDRLAGTNTQRIKQKIADRKIESDQPPPGSRGGADDIAAPVQSSEESLKNMIEAENKKGIAKIKQRQKMLDDAIDNVSPSLTGDRKYDADIVAADLAERMGLVYDDLPTKQRLDLYDQAYTGLSKRRQIQRESLEDFVDDAGGVDENDPRGIDDFIPDPEDMAKGGRVGLFAGAVASGEDISPGTDKKGNVRDDNPFTGGGGGGNDNNQTSTTPTISSPTGSPFTRSTMPPSGLVSTLSPSILARITRMSKGFKPVLGKDLGLEYETIDDLNDVLTNFKITQDIEDLIKTQKINPELKYKKEIGNNTFFDVGINKEGEAKLQFLKKFEKGGIARIGLKDGMNRRTFLKLFTGLVSLPIIGKVLKPLKVGKTVTKVPIIKTDNVAGKPEWFDQLVNKVILEGDDVSKRFATKDREIIHMKEIDDETVVRVTQDMDEGVVKVDYENPENMYGDPVQLRYKKPNPDEGDPRPSAEFDTAESIPVARADGPDDYKIDIDEGGGQSISDLVSDVSKLKQYATGQKPTLKEIVQTKKRKDQAKKISEGDYEAETDFVTNRQGEPIIDMEPDIDDVFASGGIARMLGE